MRHFFLSLFSLSLLLSIQGFSQNEKPYNTLKKIASEESNLKWIRIEAKQTTPEFLKTAKTIFELDKNSDLKIVSSESDEIGWTHNRVQQMYNNVPIEGAEYVVHEKEGFAKKANGKLVTGFRSDATPSFTKSKAIENLLKEVNAKKFAWQDEEHEKFIKSQKYDLEATFYPEAELVYFSTDFSANVDDYALAYKVDVFSIEPLERFWYYVNAQSGEVIDKLTRIHTNCHNGAGLTNYYGNVNITTCEHENEYQLKHNCSGNDGIETYSSNNSYSWPKINFTDDDNDWNSSHQKTGVEAHWGTQITYDYFYNTHNRNSFDNNGAKLLSWVNYGNAYKNAFWNGSFMTYGDGNGTSYGAFTCLDVVGHEITHAITERTAGLVYRNESGALNESFSDIFGTAIELLNDPNPNDRDWNIGEDANLNGAGFRNMSDPNAKNHPDTYNGDYWYIGNGDNGGVHSNSGVQNFWFYLLAEGGNGTNDLNVNYNVQSIGLSKAAKIAYRNLTTKLTAYSTYDDARNGAIESAEELFGENSFEVQQVINAWCAVGAGNCNTNTRTLTITSPNGGETISGSHTITWNSTGNIDYVTIDYSLNRGGTWNRLIETTENDGSYFWDVPNVQTGIAIIRITAVNDFSVRDKSNNTFSIQSCTLVANFSFDEATLCANNPITFTNQTEDVQILFNNVSYEWLIDTVLQSTNTNFTITFPTEVVRTITLKASYPNGCTSTYSRRKYIKPTPTADFVYDQKNGLTVDFSANQADATSFEWKNNETNIGNAEMISHTFAAAGTYNVCLNTNSPCGASNICKNVQVMSSDPCASSNVNANFNLPSSSCSENASTFINTSGSASSYKWYVNGQLKESSATNFTYKFPVKGNYIVYLKATDSNGCIDTHGKLVIVHPNATEINPSGDIFDCDASSATLYAGVTNMQSYSWTLASNNSVVSGSPNTNVNTSGEYIIEITDKCGNKQQGSVLVALSDTECVWPGDLNYDKTVNYQDLVYLGMHYGAKGYQRGDQKVDWQKKASVDWRAPLFNDSYKDLKHADANGNGHVDFADFIAILSNWELTHNENTGPSPSLLPAASPMALNMVPSYIPSSNGNDDLLIIDINVETETNDGVALYGGYFEIDLNQFTDGIIDYVGFEINDQNSWFFDDPFNTVYVERYNPDTRKLEVAFTQLDQSNQIGSGKIGQTIIEISNVGTTNGSTQINEVILDNVQFNNASGDLLPLYGDTLRFPAGILPSECENNWYINENTVYQNEYKAINTVQTSGVVDIVNGDTITYKAQRVTLNSGFSTKLGAKFRADSEPCSTIYKTEDDLPIKTKTNNKSDTNNKHIKRSFINTQRVEDLKD